VTPITQNEKVAVRLPVAPVQDLLDDGTVQTQDRSRMGPAALGGLTPLASAFRYIEPTWRNYIQYVDMEARTGNEDARRYLRIWQSLPYKERVSHVPEQLCELATVSSADLVAWVTKHVWVENQASTSMVLSFNRARVLDATAQFAMQDPENVRHSELFLKAAGALPQSGGRGGPPISIYNMPVASSGSVALAGAKSDSSPVDASGLRSMDNDIVELSRIMQNEGATLTARAEDVEDEPDEDDDSADDTDDDGD
jgi:hypothetical protein